MTDFPFGFDRPEDSPGFLLWQTTITWQRRIKKALHCYGVTHAQFVVLAILLWFSYRDERDAPPTQALIAGLSKLDIMTVSTSLKKLMEKDLTTREEHVRDSRANAVRLTKEGKKLALTLIPVVEAIDVAFFGVLPKRDEKSLVTLLSELMIKIESTQGT